MKTYARFLGILLLPLLTASVSGTSVPAQHVREHMQGEVDRDYAFVQSYSSRAVDGGHTFTAQIKIRRAGSYVVIAGVANYGPGAANFTVTAAAGSVQVGDQITILAGANPSGADNIDNVALQTSAATVQTLGQFNVFTVPQLMITSGDFVVGFRSSAPFPAPFDVTLLTLRRSYISSDGAGFSHIEDFSFIGNFGIRAHLTAQSSCNYTISPASQSFGAAGGNGQVSVTAATGCNWSATSNAAFITITGGAGGSGNGSVSYAVAANTGANSRTGVLTIAGQTFTVTQSGVATTSRALRAGAASGAPGGAVSVPIELLAQGDENALGFSLTFDPAILSNPQAALGADSNGASLNINGSQTAQGRFGVAIALPSGQRFNAGTRQVVNVTFTLASNISVGSTPIGFGDQPIPREISDNNATSLPASYVAGADRPNSGSEFQRADTAPRATLGDGRLTITDWVQAGRYAAGVDVVVAAGGPASPAFSAMTETGDLTLKPGASRQTTRTLRIAPASLERGQNGALIVQLDAQGNENALGFSLSFDPAQLRFVSAAPGLAGPDQVTFAKTGMSKVSRPRNHEIRCGKAEHKKRKAERKKHKMPVVIAFALFVFCFALFVFPCWPAIS